MVTPRSTDIVTFRSQSNIDRNIAAFKEIEYTPRHLDGNDLKRISSKDTMRHIMFFKVIHTCSSYKAKDRKNGV